MSRGATRRQTTQAIRPREETPVKPKVVPPCPQCNLTNCVRVLPGKKRFCTNCSIEFEEGKVYSLIDYQKAAGAGKSSEKPEYEQTFTVLKQHNKRWVVSKAKRVTDKFLDLKSQGMNPLLAAKQIAEEIGRDPDEILLLIIEMAGIDWEIVVAEKPEKEKKRFPASLRESFERG